MSWTDEYIAKRKKEDPDFAKRFDEECARLDIAVALMHLREVEGLSQRELAKKVGKPQSTIARIENGTINASYGLLCEIAEGVGKKVEIRFV